MSDLSSERGGEPAQGRRVLVAGDARGGLARVLEDAGFATEHVADGREAQRLLVGRGFGVLVCDWGLRGLGAVELLRDLRTRGRGRYTYVILTGSEEASADLERGIAAGADDFLPDPVDARSLLARMRVAERIGRIQDELTRNNERLLLANRRLEEAHGRIRRELRAAARVQQLLLPSPGLRVPGVEVAWRLRPCEELAGDLLNCFRLDERHLAFYVLDVSGHGVSAALLSVQVSRLMSPLLSQSELLKARLDEPPWYRVVPPLEVLRRLNRLFQSRADSNQYFTILYGLLELETGAVRFACAGHPGPLVARPGVPPAALSCRGHPVGFFENAEFHSGELGLGSGDRLWLFSDGVVDARSPEGGFLGTDGLARQVETGRERPLDEAVAGVLDSVERWCHPGLPDDDCSLVVIER